MVEAENILISYCDRIPEKINDLKECPNGTTEQLCHYFLSQVKFVDKRIKILSVSVSETNNRVTTLWNQVA